MASQYLSRLGIVLGVDSGELVQEVEKARQQFNKFARQVSSDSNAAAKDILALRNATEDYGKTLSKVEQIEREIKSGRYMYATKTLQDQLRAEAKAYDEKAKAMKGVSGIMTDQQKLALSYQATDLITQIASGQSPFIAILQQGGQLKDQMGGLGNMFRMLGTFITPVNVALAGTAAAIGSIGIAYYQGSEESKKFNQAMALTNQFAGIGIDKFTDLGRAISDQYGTAIGESRAVMQQLVASGQFTYKSLDSVAGAISRIASLSGTSADEVAAKLIPSLDGSASSAKRLNEQYHFLNLAQLKQIENLEKQGDKQAAVKLTAELLTQSLNQQEVRLGYIEKLWKGVKDAASDFWDWAKSVGREKDPLRELLDDQVRLMESYVRMGGEGAIKGVRYQAALAEYKRIAAEIDAQEAKKQKEADIKANDETNINDYLSTGGSDRSLQMKKQLAKTRYEEWIEWAKLTATEEEKIQLDALKKIADKAIDLEYTGAQEKRARGLALLEQYEADKAAIEAEADRKRAESRKKAQWEADQRWFDNLANVGERLEREQAKIFADIASKRDEVTSTKEQIQSKFSLLGATQKEIDLTMSRIEYQKELNKLQRSQEFKNMDSGKQKEALQELESIQKAKEANIELAESLQKVQGMYDIVWSNMSSAIEKFVRTGKFSIKDFTRSVIQDMLIMQMKLQAMQLIRGILGSFMAGFNTGSVGNATTMAPGGGYFADGGNPPVGKVSVVGERGPELFVPRTAGTIIPNHALAGMGSTTNVTNNYINAIDAKSFEQRLLESNQAIWSANQYATKNLATNYGRT